jgi:hypothetical protein
MALLDIQAMDAVREDKGCPEGSNLSVLLCDSTFSIHLC